MPYTIGMTGGIGSGKSSVAGVFQEFGASVIDTDAIAHNLTGPGGAAIAPLLDAFGKQYIDARGALDRTRMRGLAFSDPTSRRKLETILHPMIRMESARLADAAQGPYVMLVIPLLVESETMLSSGQPRFQRILVVDCPEQTQIERTIRRSNLPESEIRAIMASQASRAQRLAAADDVIDNSGSPEAVRPQIGQLHQRYLDLATAWNKSGR
jgi:dephospho-CoA kinase